jgi:TPR repeat protein
MQRLLMKFPLVVILSSAVCFAGDYEDGTAAFDRGDYAIALKKLHPLAEQGNALAQNSLGVMYVEGKGVSQDYDEAIRWFRKAADQDSPRRRPIWVGCMSKERACPRTTPKRRNGFAMRRTKDSRWRNTI